MRTIFKIAIAAAAAVALAISSADVSAQTRSGRSGGSSSRGTTSVSRSTGSATRSSGSAATRSSGSVSRSSGSASRSGSVGTTPQTTTRARGGTVSRSSGSATRSSGSIDRTGGSSRSSGGSSRSGSSVSRSGGSTRSSGTVSSSSGSATRSNGSVSRSSGSNSSRASSGVSRSSGSSSSRSGSSTRAAVRNRDDRGYDASRSYDRQTAGPAGQVRFDNHGDRIPPRHRDFIAYDRPGFFYGHNPHYFGYRVRYLPYYRRARFWGIDYYIYNNIYYRYYLGNYIICRPPFGVLFDIALYDLELDVLRFAYYNNVYRTYRVVDSNYDTIQEQNRIIAENNATIAAQNATIAANNATAAAQQAQAQAQAATPEVDLNTLKSAASYELATRLGLVQSFAAADTEYYYDDGVFFTKGSDSQYKVIVPPAGALIKALPDDYDTVTLADGNDYFKVDDTIYRTTVVDGVPYFEVVGQMPEELAKKYAKAD